MEKTVVFLVVIALLFLAREEPVVEDDVSILAMPRCAGLLLPTAAGRLAVLPAGTAAAEVDILLADFPADADSPAARTAVVLLRALGAALPAVPCLAVLASLSDLATKLPSSNYWNTAANMLAIRRQAWESPNHQLARSFRNKYMCATTICKGPYPRVRYACVQTANPLVNKQEGGRTI